MAFVLSMHRCATQSAHQFLVSAGYNAIHNPSGRSKLDFQHEWVGRESDLDFIFDNLMQKVSGRFNAVSDNPMAALHEQALRAFPDGKFILVTREPQEWVNSVREHIKDRAFVPAEKIQYWRYLSGKPEKITDISDADLIRAYDDHIAQTRDHFAKAGKSDNLSIVDLDMSDEEIGQRLSAFLGTPPQPFPHIDTKKFKHS